MNSVGIVFLLILLLQGCRTFKTSMLLYKTVSAAFFFSNTLRKRLNATDVTFII